MSEKPIKGTVAEISPSVFAIQTKDSTYYIPHSLVKWLAISKGVKRNTGKGVLIGAISGSFILGIRTVATNAKQVPCDFYCGPEFSNSGAFTIGAVAGLIVGGLVGAYLGDLIRTERWERVPVNISMRVSPGPNNNLGFEPSISIRFRFGK